MTLCNRVWSHNTTIYATEGFPANHNSILQPHIELFVINIQYCTGWCTRSMVAKCIFRWQISICAEQESANIKPPLDNPPLLQDRQYHLQVL